MNTLTKIITVRNRFGLHMRPAAEVSKLAYEYDAIVALNKGDRIAHAHSVVEMLTLGAFRGDEIKVTALGNDAEAALSAIVGYFDDYTDDGSPADEDPDSAAA